jgi:hypothetical protein
MMTKFIVAISVLLFGGNHTCSNAEDQRGYQECLKRVIDLLNQRKPVSNELLGCSIPEKQEEVSIFFELDYNKNTTDAFRTLNKLVVEASIGGDHDVLKKYILHSQFVDGYFAEDYFDSIGLIIERQHTLFCTIVKEVPAEKIERLKKLDSYNCVP